MHTITTFIKSTEPISEYLKQNTIGSRAVRNTANFLIRNIRSALSKSPEERTHNETEAVHLIFTGIQKMNAQREANRQKKISDLSQKYQGAELQAEIKALKPLIFLPYPTREHWMLSYEQIDAILKTIENEAYYSCTSQVNQKAIRKTCESWKGFFEELRRYQRHPEKFNGRPKAPEKPSRVLGIDLGVSNFAVCAANTGCKPLLISGKWIKSENQWYNKERARLYSVLTKGHDLKKEKKIRVSSKRLQRLSAVRENRFNNFFYHAAHRICKYSKEHEIEVIVVGLNQSSNERLMNADVNGAINIARKEYPEAFLGFCASSLFSVDVVTEKNFRPKTGPKPQPKKKIVSVQKKKKHNRKTVSAKLRHQYRRDRRQLYKQLLAM